MSMITVTIITCTTVSLLLSLIFTAVFSALCVAGAIATFRDMVSAWRENDVAFENQIHRWFDVVFSAVMSIACAALFALLVSAPVWALYNPTEAQERMKQAQELEEKPEGLLVFWLGEHVAIELTLPTEIAIYGPYCD